MNKQEYEAKSEEFSEQISAFDNDPEYFKKFPEIWDDAFDIETCSRYHRMAKNISKESINFGYQLAQAEIEELKIQLEQKEFTLQNTFDHWQNAMSDRDALTERIKIVTGSSKITINEYREELEELKRDSMKLVEAGLEFKKHLESYCVCTYDEECDTHYYFDKWNEALTEWNKKRGEV